MTNTISNLPSKMFSQQKQYKCLRLEKSSDILGWFFFLTLQIPKPITPVLQRSISIYYLFNCYKKVDFLISPSMHLEGR